MGGAARGRCSPCKLLHMVLIISAPFLYKMCCSMSRSTAELCHLGAPATSPPSSVQGCGRETCIPRPGTRTQTGCIHFPVDGKGTQGFPLPANSSCLLLLLSPSPPSPGAEPALLLGEASELSPGSGSIPAAFPLSHRVICHL